MAFQSMPTSGKPCPETERTVSRNRFPEGKNQSLVKSPGQRNPMQYSKALSTVKRTKLLIYYMVTFGGEKSCSPGGLKAKAQIENRALGLYNTGSYGVERGHFKNTISFPVSFLAASKNQKSEQGWRCLYDTLKMCTYEYCKFHPNSQMVGLIYPSQREDACKHPEVRHHKHCRFGGPCMLRVAHLILGSCHPDWGQWVFFLCDFISSSYACGISLNSQ